ncbi:MULTISPECIES: pyruvate, phosphate dikinase [unclassified Streptomyces]|uniref:pyruvate, phosphate dikinase n=1 Tax=unclassified Streptomyces TaxID=2593676 RepID=UPI000F7194A5|nr:MULTISPECIES: pyruvate, phosphate dikinase [unclassified Streptomyces]AZM63258.1 pyruvate, phosphate dikinase [Streptomyces sp. WAC 01438]RSN00706.1 pyruvate, phosphate dikinase [Streptomyces sp. WAC 01420]
MRWIRTISAQAEETAETLGGKARGLVLLHRLGLPVPAGFVITTEACRAFLRGGRLPDGLDDELATAMADLELSTGRAFGGPRKPLAVSVRSGAGVSMPGMMSTILNLGLTTEATAGLAAETDDRPFALNSRLRFLASFASAITNSDGDGAGAVHGARPGRGTEDEEARLTESIAAVENLVRERCDQPIPDDAARQLRLAVEAVFSSWNAPRARTYREVNDIPHDLGTAVIVQRMVFGNRDGHSGTGVAFSRNPNTGENIPFGEVLFGCQGEEVVSGTSTTRPLSELAQREPAVWTELLDALRRIEAHYRDACYVEFTFQSGELWILQVRPGRFVGGAAVRVATELVGQRVIGRHEALLRVSSRHLRHVRTPRIASSEETDVFARGIGACPGVAAGRIATTADGAVRMARTDPVILVRPETSPNDMHGLAAAAGIVTARGGPASHAAVVARAMGKPAVVGVAGLAVDRDDGSVTVGGRTVGDGTFVTIDGTSGEVALGSPRVVADAADEHVHRLLAWADDVSGDHSAREDTQRLDAAHAALRHR